MEEAEAREDLAAQGLERRLMPRCALDEDAVLLLVGRGNRIHCRMVELSLSGCRMSTGERLPAASGARAEATFKVQGIAFRFAGAIEWVDDKGLLGIRFIDVIPRRRDELIEVLRELEAEIAAKQESEAAERRAEEERASQDSEKQAAGQADPLPILDRLWDAPIQNRSAQASHPVAISPPERPALKPVAEPILPAPPLPAASQPPRPQPPELPPASQRPPMASKRDRRTQSRHAVDTTAVIFLINVGSRLNGRILDLSVGGCRIRTDERFPVGIYTRVETEFLLEGLPFRMGGVIQAVHDRDRRLVGIRFLDVSARKREQLEQLMAEIEEMRAEQDQPKAGDPSPTTDVSQPPENVSKVPVAS